MPTQQEGVPPRVVRPRVAGDGGQTPRWLISRDERDRLYRRERTKDHALALVMVGCVLSIGAAALLHKYAPEQPWDSWAAAAGVGWALAAAVFGFAVAGHAAYVADGAGTGARLIDWPPKPAEQPRPDAIMFCLDETMDMDEELRLRVLRRYTAGHVQVFEYRLPTEKERRESDVQEQ